MKWESVVLCILLFVYFVFVVRVYQKANDNRKYNHARFIARIGIFAAMSTILYVVPIFKFPIPIFPSFLEFHFDEIPAFIAGFAYGPLAGFFVILIKTIIKLPMTNTLLVGELTDLILSSIYVVTASIVYKKMRNLKGVAIGFGIATVLQVFVAMVLNVYAMIPFYSRVMGYPIEALLGMMQKAVPSITDTGWSYAFFAVLPFNLMKDGIVIVVTFLVYRSIHKMMRFDKTKPA